MDFQLLLSMTLVKHYLKEEWQIFYEELEVDSCASINWTFISCSVVHRVCCPSALLVFFSFSPVTSKEKKKKKKKKKKKTLVSSSSNSPSKQKRKMAIKFVYYSSRKISLTWCWFKLKKKEEKIDSMNERKSRTTDWFLSVSFFSLCICIYQTFIYISIYSRPNRRKGKKIIEVI